MKFEIGPYAYRLRMQALPHDMFGHTFHRERAILISPDCPGDELLTTVLHELKHAWDAVLPCAGGDDEAKSEYFSAVATVITRQLNSQGGEYHLRRWHRDQRESLSKTSTVAVEVLEEEIPEVDPDQAIDPWVYLAKPAPKGKKTVARDVRAGCSCCERVFGAPCLFDNKPRFDEAASGLVIDRQLYCPACRHLECWSEGVTPWGTPNGVLAYERIKASEGIKSAWLAQNPAASRVDFDL